MNTHVRDNLLATAAGVVTTAGDMAYATAANTLARLAVGAASAVMRSTGSAPSWVTNVQITGGGDLSVGGALGAASTINLSKTYDGAGGYASVYTALVFVSAGSTMRSSIQSRTDLSALLIGPETSGFDTWILASNQQQLRASTTGVSVGQNAIGGASTVSLSKTYDGGGGFADTRAAILLVGASSTVKGSFQAGTAIGKVVIGSETSHTFEIFTAGTARWQVTSAGHLIAATDNAYDIGASAATRPRTGYFGTSVVVGSGAAPFPLTSSVADCSADTALTSSTWNDVTGCSLSLAAGTWLITATCSVDWTGGGANGEVYCRVFNSTDTTTVISTMSAFGSAAGYVFKTTEPMTYVVTLAATKTIKLQAYPLGITGTNVRRLNGVSLVATSMQAVRIG